MKKGKKALSMALVIIFLFGIVAPQSVIAYEIGKAYATVSKLYYSSLTNEEQLKLKIEVKADDEFFQTCEAKGYNLEESKGISYLKNTFLFTIDEGGRFLEGDKDNTKIQSLSKLESIFTSETSIDKKEQLKELIQDEYNVDSIKDAYDMATILKGNVNNFIAKDAVINNEEELLKIKEVYGGAEATLLRKMLKYKSFNVKGLMDWAEQNKKNIFQIYMTLSENTLNGNEFLPKLKMSDSTKNIVQSLQRVDNGGTQESKEYIPFKMDNNNKESINLSDGSLNLENPNYSLEGRSNLDLNINTRYNSTQANFHDVTREVTYYDVKNKYIEAYVMVTIDGIEICELYFGKVYMDDPNYFSRIKEIKQLARKFISENPPTDVYSDVYWIYKEENYTDSYCTNKLIDKTYTEKRNGLGTGWSWGFSSIETTSDKKKYLHLGSGEVYEIDYSTSSSSLKNAPLKDKTFSNDNGTFTNGEVKSSYVLKYKTGINEYFAEDGRLLGIVDRFGNTITFKHKLINGSDDTYVISEIIDTLNRKTTFTYNDKTTYSTVPGAKDVIVALPDGNQIKFILEPISNIPNKFILKKKIYQLGRVTNFNYEVKESKVDSSKVNNYALLSSVEESTGYKYEYTYEIAKEKNSNIEYYRTKTRKDVSLDKDNKRTESNIIEYKYFDGSNKTQRIDDKLITESVFNESKLNTKNLYYDKGVYVVGSNDNTKALIKTEDITYNSNKLPTDKVTTYYDKVNKINTKKIRESSEYDNYGNITKVIDGKRNETSYLYTVQTYKNLNNSNLNHIYSFLNQSIRDKEVIKYSTDKNDVIGNISNKTIMHKENGKESNIVYNYIYDGFGNLAKESMTNKDGKVIEKSYEYSKDYGNAYLTKTSQKITDVNNNSMTVTSINKYDLSTGLVTETTIPVTNKDGKIENRITTHSYDILGRIKQTINPDNSKITVEYDDKNNISILTRENGLKIKKSYDGSGKLLETTDNSKGEWTILEKIYYDNYSRVIAKEDALTNKTTTTYDPLGRVLKTTDPDSTVVEVSYDDYNMKKTITNYNTTTKEVGATKEDVYDEVGNLVSETILNGKDKITTTNLYNPIGKVIETTDGNEKKKYYEYDDLGRLIKVRISVDKDKSGAIIYEDTTYEYDYLNNLIKTTTSGGSEIKKQYDELGRLIKETSAELKSELYLYNEAGLLIAKTDKAGVETRYTYDLRNRVLSETKGNIAFKYSYDDKNNGKTVEKYTGKDLVETSYYKLNLDDTLAYSWTADKSGDKKQISYEYNNNKVKTSMTDQLNKKTSYDYTSKNQLKTVKSQNGTTTKTEVEYKYTLDGKTLTTVYENGDNASYDYNVLRLLTKLTNKNKQGNILSSYEYSYDRNGNKTFEKERILSSGALVDKITTYSYDFANRVKNVVYPDGKKVEYSYDGNGNIQGTNTYKNDKLIENSINYYDKDNKLTKTETFGNIKELTITPNKNNIVGDEVITFKVSGKYNDGTAITQDDLKNVKWTSGNPAFKLSSSVGENITGKFDLNYIKEKNIKESTGTLDIWAEKDGVRTKVSLQYKIDIVVKLIDSIVIEADKTSIVDSEVATFKVTGKYKDGTPLSKEDLSRVAWISNKPDAFIISKTTGESVTGKLLPEYFKKIFNKDFSGELKVIANLDNVSNDMVIKYKSNELENKNITLTISSSKPFLKDKESAILTVTGKYKDGKTLSDEVLSKVKWISSDYNIYFDKAQGQQGKTITIRNCDTSGDIIPIELSAFAIKKGSDILSYDIEFPRPEYPSPVIIDDRTINSKITAYLEDEAVWSEIIIKCDIPTRRQDDPIWGRVEDSMGTTNEFKINIKKENSNPSEKKIGYSLQNSLMPTAIVSSVVGERMPLINTEFKYDLNGNLIAKIVNSELIESYGYNEFNQLISYSNKTTGKNFTYDYYANGQRKSKCGDGQITSFLYDGENIIIELGNDGKLKNRYSIGHSYLSKEENNGNKYYYCYDAHGDVKLLTDGVGNVVKNYVYDIYGKEDKANDNQGIENSIRYAGQYYDAESGLYYLRARYYSPEIMRFISEDTYKGKIEDPLSLNLYGYCVGDPINQVDPSGNMPGFIRDALKSLVSTFAKDWRENTVMNLVCVFGGGITGGIKGFKNVQNINKGIIFSSKKNPLMNTITCTFTGMMKGFFTGLGIGRISDVLGTLGKYTDIEGAFDKTWIGKSIDSGVSTIENKLMSLIDKM